MRHGGAARRCGPVQEKVQESVAGVSVAVIVAVKDSL